MRARREHDEARAGRSGTHAAHDTLGHTDCSTAWLAALCETSGVRRVAGRGAGVLARARPHGAPARHVPPVSRRYCRHRGRTQDGVRGVSSTTGREALELFRRRRRNLPRTRHARCNERSGVHIRDHVGWCDPCAQRSVCARRPASLPVHHQPSSWHVNIGAVRVGRVRRQRVRRTPRAALPGRARAREGRTCAHEPAQQPRGPEDSKGPGAARVQVPRRIGVVRHAHVLARAAALPRRGRRAARALRPRQAGHRQLAAPRARRAHRTATASCACEETEAEPRSGARAAQDGAGVPDAVAVVLRARRRRRLLRHAPQDMQQNFQRRRRLRVPVLRARLQHGAARTGDQVPLSLQLVLQRVLRHVRRAHRDARLQLTARPQQCVRSQEYSEDEHPLLLCRTHYTSGLRRSPTRGDIVSAKKCEVITV